jgi:hypothetical protein
VTGPDHYRRAEELLAEASKLNRFRPHLTSGPNDIPMRGTDIEQLGRLSEDPGLPDRNIAEAHVHATLALAAATALTIHGVREHTEDGREWRKAAATKPNP